MEGRRSKPPPSPYTPPERWKAVEANRRQVHTRPHTGEKWKEKPTMGGTTRRRRSPTGPCSGRLRPELVRVCSAVRRSRR